jgi:hypothetical protein
MTKLMTTARPTADVHGATWLRNADACAAFMLHGRLPSEKATDPAEKKFGRWLAGQRRNPDLDGLRADYLDAVCAGWRVNILEVVWDRHLAAVVAFRDAHDRLPSEDATDPAERASGQWLGKQCEQNRRPAGLTGTRPQKFEAALPGWQLKLAEYAWLQDATEVGLFMQKTGRRPRRKTGTPNDIRLGVWLHNQRRRLDSTQPGHRARIAALDKLAPGWR